MRMLRGLLLGIACLVMLPASAYAQASITGVVKDSSGAVLPGVTVEAASPVLIEKVVSAVTDSSGLYRLVDLRPGVYSMTFSLPGFTTVKREGVELTGSFTATINADLKVGALAETITVTGETPVVDVQNTRRETVISKDIINALPATRAYGSLLNAMPGVTVDTNGLATSPTMTFFTAHGGNSNEGRMSINGMTVAAAFNGGGVSSLVYDTTNLEEVTMLVSGGLGESETGGPAMNLVPRSGGNRFAGQAFFSNAGTWSRGENLDDALRTCAAGGTPGFAAPCITQGPGIKNAYDLSGALGGPIKRDRIWFYGSYRDYSTTAGIEGLNVNKFIGQAAHWDYAKDDAIEPRAIQGRKIPSGRVTAQLTARNRVTFSHEQQARCEGTTLTVAGKGCRTREADWIGIGGTPSSVSSPEATTAYFDLPYWVTQGTWTSPVTSKLLLEAGYSRFAYRHAGGPGQIAPDGIFNLIPVSEQLARDGHNANFLYRGLGSYSDNFGNPNSWRASASYITGAHAMKFGYQGSYLIADTNSIANDSQLTYRFNNGVPNAFSYRLQQFQQADRTKVAAFYAQDTWTHSRLSLQGAIRYDNASSFSPAEHNGTTVITRFNAAPITVERTDGANYKDISPRFGAAFDVFGNGKTALKFNIGRYLAPATNDTNYTVNNPAQRVVTTVANRSWSDTNGNFIVDCDINNPAQQVVPGGDTCGANTSTGGAINFGKPGAVTASTNPDVLNGWGRRPVDWQWGLNLQQELRPRVSLEVGYNRRWWSNFLVTDNTLVTPADYQKWTITAPTDSRLPNGGGYPIDIYTLTAAGNAKGSFNYTTWETDFGPGRIRYWQGVDVTLNARVRQGLTLQFGTSTGRQIQDTCATSLLLDNPDPRNCRSVDPIETTLRGLASYMVPKAGVQISATMRSQPRSLTSASYLVPNTVVQSILGRLPPGGLATGNTTVFLTDNSNRVYNADRRTQIDMRFAKLIKFSGRRLDVGVDLQNLLNTNYGTAFVTQYDYVAANGGTWNNPTAILAPRFVRLNLTLDF
jgi:hypothetical protein